MLNELLLAENYQEVPKTGIETIDRYVSHHAALSHTDRNCIMPALLAAAGTAAGKHQRIVFDGYYYNTPMLWTVTVGRSGANKSTPMEKVLAPLQRIDRQLVDRYNALVEQAKSHKRERGQKDPALKVKKDVLIINDTTHEARLEVMAASSHGVLQYLDEISSFCDSMGQYKASAGSSAEVAALLSIYDARDVKVTRKTDTISQVDAPFMCVCGTTQPMVWQSLYSENSSWMFRGFTQRFTPFRFEEPSLEPSPATPDFYDLDGQWEKILRRLYELPPSDITLSDGAQPIYMRFKRDLAAIRADLPDDKFSAFLQTVLSKSEIQTLRLALVHALLAYAAGDIGALEAGVLSTRWAIETQKQIIRNHIFYYRRAQEKPQATNAIRDIAKAFDVKIIDLCRAMADVCECKTDQIRYYARP